MARLLLIIVGLGLFGYGLAGWFELVPIDGRISRKLSVDEILAGKAEPYQTIRVDNVGLELSKGIENREIGSIFYPIKGSSGKLALDYWNQSPRPAETLTVYGIVKPYEKVVPQQSTEPAPRARPTTPEFFDIESRTAAPATAPASQSAATPALVLSNDTDFLPHLREHASFWMDAGGVALALAIAAQIAVWVGRSRLAAETRLPVSAPDELCFTCGQTIRLIPCFLRVRANRTIGYKRYRKRSFETRCGICPVCYRKFRAAQNRRAGFVAVIWVACLVAPLAAILTRSIPLVMLAVPVSLFGGFFLFSAWMNTLYERALGQPLSDDLKQRVGVSSWNLADRLRMVRRGY